MSFLFLSFPRNGSLLNKLDRNSLIERVQNFSQDPQGKWGAMTAQEAVVHMSYILECGLGCKDIPFVPSFFSWPIIKELGLLGPWPLGAPTAPQVIGRAIELSEVVHSDIVKLESLIRKWEIVCEDAVMPLHPTFGELNAVQWSFLMYRHIDHHLRQFGL